MFSAKTIQIISALLLFNSLHLSSQVVVILNETSREPIENAAVYNKTRSYATLSDSEGKANISKFIENDSIFFQHSSFNLKSALKKDLHDGQRIYLSKRVILIDEFVISATKTRENKRDVPFMIDVLPPSFFERNTSQNSADLLMSTGNLVVQKSQGGGGSPIIRGFEANKVLLVVDGVRMNNAIYRSGHLQNSLTIDNAVLERLEVIYGPTSLIYGSDALGGVVHYYTKDPVLSDEDKKYRFGANAYTEYSTANTGKIAHLDINNGFKKIGFLSSITYKDFGDIKMGENKNPFYGDYGELHHYVKQINGRDTIVGNPNPFIQKNTGYSQLDLLQKIKYSPSAYYDLIINLQYSSSSNIDRFDKLNDYSGNQMKYAEYYYGPQNRLLTSLKSVVKKDNYFFTNLTSTLAYQRIDEDRISRKFRNEEKLHQKEDVDVVTLNFDFLKLVKSNSRINYGLEYTYNRVLSQAYYRNMNNGNKSPAETRYPDDGTDASSYSAYINYKWVPDPRFVYSAGMRYNYGIYKSGFTPENPLPYNNVEVNNGALTGSLSLVYHPGRKWQINAIASTGFRNPNVDDYGKVRAKDNQVTVPNPDLSSEYTYNFELGLSKTIEGYIKVSATGYYSLLTNAIVRTDYRLNGQDSLEYDGDMYKIITNTNAARAYIRGLSLSVNSDLNSNLSFKSTLNFTEGKNTSDNVKLGHIPPVFGRTSVRYNMKKMWSELFVDYNGWKHIEDMSPYEEDNDAEATEHGFPGWYSVNLRSSFALSETFRLQIAIENIFDSFYKPFASGIAAPGRNFILTVLRFKGL